MVTRANSSAFDHAFWTFSAALQRGLCHPINCHSEAKSGLEGTEEASLRAGGLLEKTPVIPEATWTDVDHPFWTPFGVHSRVPRRLRSTERRDLLHMCHEEEVFTPKLVNFEAGFGLWKDNAASGKNNCAKSVFEQQSIRFR